MNCTYCTFVYALLTPYQSICQHHLIQYVCGCVPPLRCLSPPTVCVGVCLCVCMCLLSDSVSQGSRGSCQKVVALVSLVRKMSISRTTWDATCLTVADKKQPSGKPVKFTTKAKENRLDLIVLRLINTSAFSFPVMYLHNISYHAIFQFSSDGEQPLWQRIETLPYTHLGF